MTAMKPALVVPARSTTVKIAILLLVAAAIAAVAPFDLAFDAATGGNPLVRAVAIVGLALIGIAIAPHAGLTFSPTDRKWPVLMPLLTAVVVALWCVAVDWLFRAQLHPAYVAFIRQEPVATRIVIMAMRAVNENIIYRLFVTTALVAAIGRVWRAGNNPASGGCWTAIVLAQVLNIVINVAAPTTPLIALHDALRYVVPGIVWGWLYWKRGFQSVEIACTSVHLALQPLLTMAFA